MSWWTNLVSRLRRFPPPDPEVRVREGGFDVISVDKELRLATVNWKDVDQIETYKLDLITTDCVCLLFRIGDEEVQLSEEWEGFHTLFGPLNDNFPSIGDDWYANVVQPPFEAKRTVLFTSSEAA